MYDHNIPETDAERKKLLCEQMALLVGRSKSTSTEKLAELTKAMVLLELAIKTL